MRSNSRWILLLFISLASTAQAQRDVFTTNTSYEVVGATSRMGMDAPYTRTIDEYVVHSDALVRTDGRYVYVLNRLFADNVLVLDAADDYSVVNQYSVTSVGLNPSDLVVVSPHKAYISLYESNSVMICHPLTGAVLGTIDLSGFAPRYFPEEVVRYTNSLIQDRVLFGTDWPVIPIDRWLEEWEQLPIKPEVRSKVMLDNAVRLLGMESGGAGT